MALADPCCFFADSSPTEASAGGPTGLQADGLHLTTKAQLELGRRLQQAYLEASFGAVGHDSRAQRFFLRSDPGVYLSFRREKKRGRKRRHQAAGGGGGQGGDVLDFWHTFTPTERRGEGLASRLVEGALAFAQAHGCRVHASCSFVGKYVSNHRVKYGSLLSTP